MKNLTKNTLQLDETLRSQKKEENSICKILVGNACLKIGKILCLCNSEKWEDVDFELDQVVTFGCTQTDVNLDKDSKTWKRGKYFFGKI